MADRLAGERLPIGDGPTAEVTEIVAWAIYRAAVVLVAACNAAEGDEASIRTLREVYAFFVAEAQPTWSILDHRGPILPTAEGMLRLPVNTALGLVEGWMQTFGRTSAVDEMIPPGPLRDELNRGLKAARSH